MRIHLFYLPKMYVGPLHLVTIGLDKDLKLNRGQVII